MPKTIFKTSEKSNFILNLRKSSIRRMIIFVLCAVPIIMSLCMLPEYLDNGSFAFGSIGISVCGIAAVAVIAILLARQLLPKSQLLPVCIGLGVIATAAISLANAYSFDVAFSGLAGRYEGLLTIICYVGIFLLGMQLPAESKHVRLMDCIVISGVFQCVIGAFQMIPMIKFNPYYNTLIPLTGELSDSGVFLPYGTVGSPIFLAAFLCLTTAVSACGACYDSSDKRRRLYALATIAFIVMSSFTHSVIAAMGMTLVLLILIISEIVRSRKASGKTLHATHPMLLLIIFALILVAFQIISFSKNKIFYDGGIIWQDSSHRLFVTGTHYQAHSSFDASSLYETYSYLWLSTIEAIKKYALWLFGTGPDCLYFTQFKTTSIIVSETDAFDRCYNEYLYILATRGIPALIAYAGLLFVAIKRSLKNIKSFLANDNLWIYVSLLCGVLMYTVISFFCASVPTVSALFWLLLGAASRRDPENEKLPVEQK